MGKRYLALGWAVTVVAVTTSGGLAAPAPAPPVDVEATGRELERASKELDKVAKEAEAAAAQVEQLAAKRKDLQTQLAKQQGELKQHLGAARQAHDKYEATREKSGGAGRVALDALLETASVEYEAAAKLATSCQALQAELSKTAQELDHALVIVRATPTNATYWSSQIKALTARLKEPLAGTQAAAARAKKAAELAKASSGFASPAASASAQAKLDASSKSLVSGLELAKSSAKELARARRGGGSPLAKCDLRKTDWSAHDYEGIKLEEGDEMNGTGLGDVIYGDLTGDGYPEAIVTVSTVYGMNNGTTTLYVYGSRPNCGLTLLGTVDGPGGCSGTIEASVEAQTLRTTEPYLKEGDGRCFPSGITRTDWKVVDGKLKQVAKR